MRMDRFALRFDFDYFREEVSMRRRNCSVGRDVLDTYPKRLRSFPLSLIPCGIQTVSWIGGNFKHAHTSPHTYFGMYRPVFPPEAHLSSLVSSVIQTGELVFTVGFHPCFDEKAYLLGCGQYSLKDQVCSRGCSSVGKPNSHSLVELVSTVTPFPHLLLRFERVNLSPHLLPVAGKQVWREHRREFSLAGDSHSSEM